MSSMIVTLIHKEINIKDGKMFFNRTDLLSHNLNNNKTRVYRVIQDNFEYDLLCPERITETQEKMVFWPSFKLPYRKYPVYVYLYAAALYLSTEKSMREVAFEIRRKFGLEKFSHSTVSRTLKKLRNNLDILIEIGTQPEDFKTPVKRRKWDNKKSNEYENLLRAISTILIDSKTNSFGSLLNYKFFSKTGKFLL